MVTLCDTCDRVREVFQLPGRKDNNCGECSADIAMLISLHALITKANCQGESVTALETEAVPIIHRLLRRCEFGSYAFLCSNNAALPSSENSGRS